ncbi:T9SS-dependent M36 family metallopeptidase [Aequorivita echinoideorum]|uniref:T9SS-dependent M36 family metallopeptidase n=1 Tax=Aequorivita echinoideorum TaxID=1549647 RepID=A0ABS5S5W4_9FLAO|nr:T9SS-dependent M36 family metallopeptidase [Aequorivita echinoideorum]MBT0607815.1 T9SS-dependent M36 family metallopeptidase [Aequorivita echinoideorum]
MKKFFYLLLFFTVSLVTGQESKIPIKSYLENNRTQLQLQSQDISEISIASQSFSKSLNADNVYVEQRYQDIRIFNSVSPFVLKNGQVISAKVSFIQNIASKANAATPTISAASAITNAANQLGLQAPSGLSLLETGDDNNYIFTNGNISLENIPVELVYQKLEDSNTLKLAWNLSIYLLDGSHYYSVRVDAQTGTILATDDWVVSCNFDDPNKEHSHSTEVSSQNINSQSILFAPAKQSIMVDGSQYRVFPIPVESPNHGVAALVSEPADPIASPFGWHDTNGATGAEFTITRGNNVYAQDDINGNNGFGSAPDGGADLDFDYDFNFSTQPVNMLDAATVNLFYLNNIMHDVWYRYGFDEASGNFQQNNYGNGGNAGDFVIADAQDGSGLNNANFGTPPDGGSGRMQMFLWNANGPPGEPLTINNGPLAGGYTGVPAQFGAPLTNVPITSDLVLVVDDNSGGTSTDIYDGCDVITNAAAINNKIAVLRRGDCEFGVKVLNAENAGAIAVIVVNNVAGAPIAMGPGAAGDQVTIPSIMVSQADGDAIIAQLLAPATVNGTLVEAGPFQIDGDVDNSIIAHEYGHGISNRLTGGPNAAGCLQNDEQMGEGWSDYFGLILTMKEGDAGEDGRGFATYVLGQPLNGLGLRTKRYSTDFTVNNFTYDNIKSPSISIPHGVGSVWATMLWDLTWDLIDEYGFDPDIYNGTGGNNIALQLVVDGLKLQPCNPGFVSGRDAILEADEIANGGANRCIIWRAFARRGLGLSANQGSSFSRSDGAQAFDVPADCVLGVDDQGNLDNNFIIYPNPSNGEVNIKAKYAAGDATISIFDMNGREVFNQQVEMHNVVNINAGGLKSGIYLIKIDGENYSHTSKLIIN